MSGVCGSCKMKFERNQRIPFLLNCNDVICSECIKFNIEIYNKGEELECPICCNVTKSTKTEIKALYPVSDEEKIINANQGSVQGEFDILIKLLNREALKVKTNKNMTIGELIRIVARQKGINETQFHLAFKQPLRDKNKTLEYYQITDNVTLMQVNTLEGGLKK